ncbi:ArnT family glycosyltransferase [Flavihumibacter sp. UBA7668]|uniref:ArnT family glycosyltransferase n=1 Tax=Flavihumibacter sp. UBA7668 TaxID=1946542 RepID=UPI0025C1C5C0|nr:glycosyltransferase family 39 protein [Flavihumibacter sp. UBA7668]
MNVLTSSIQRRPALWFYLGWLFINLVQSFGTELLHDEAYYWVYSQYPAWGYFDHPPMIAILIKLGYLVFPNELGVRFFMALMNTATLWLVHQLLVKKDDALFYVITASMGVLQIGGILAVPDIPLTFFTALFFWQYKRFIEKDNWLQGLLLGIVMAGMLYSKYHGILIILFTVLSNLRLALNPRAWLAVITGVALFYPHLHWQYVHDFPSVSYHLKERNAPVYRFAFTLEYVAGQILLAGPLIGFFLLKAANQYKTINLYSRALQWSMWGFYGFFLISTFKGRVEANWTVPALVPVIILSHAWLADNLKQRSWIFKLLAPSLVLVVIVRLYMLSDISALTRIFKDELHGNAAWASAIKAKSNNLPVVFLNSYQRPSKYWFYSGDTSFAINTTNYRRNNYNFWPIERDWQGRTVLLADNGLTSMTGSFQIETVRGPITAVVDSNLQSFSHIQLTVVQTPAEGKKGDLLKLTVKVSKESMPAFEKMLTGFSEENGMIADLFVGKLMVQRFSLRAEKAELNNYHLTSRDSISLEPGQYILKLGIPTSIPNQYSQNSAAMKIEIR